MQDITVKEMIKTAKIDLNEFSVHEVKDKLNSEEFHIIDLEILLS